MAKMSVSSDPWQFVNISEPTQSRDQRLKYIVRANATRKIRRRQKQGRTRSSDHKLVKTNQGNPLAVPQPAGVSQHSDRPKDVYPPIGKSQDVSFGWPTEWDKVLTEAQTIFLPAVHPSAANKKKDKFDENESIDLQLDPLAKSTRQTPTALACQTLIVSPRVALGSGIQDPFNMNPLGGGVQTSELLYHCMCIHSQTLIESRPQISDAHLTLVSSCYRRSSR